MDLKLKKLDAIREAMERIPNWTKLWKEEEKELDRRAKERDEKETRDLLAKAKESADRAAAEEAKKCGGN
jgi:hypothetical protein